MKLLDVPVAGDVLKGLTKVLEGDVLTFITFKRLTCIETEDITGADEPYLTFWPSTTLDQLDEQAQRTLRTVLGTTPLTHLLLRPPPAGVPHRTRPLNNGQFEDLKISYPIVPGQDFAVTLYDEDNGTNSGMDPDDLLDKDRFTVYPAKVPEPAGSCVTTDTNFDHKIALSGDDARYTLSYKLDRLRLRAVKNGDKSSPLPDVGGVFGKGGLVGAATDVIRA